MSPEFKDKPKEFLQSVLLNLESYKQGAIDTIEVLEVFIKDLKIQNINLYDSKIDEIKKIIGSNQDES